MSPFDYYLQVVTEGGFPFFIHEHISTRTVEDAEQNLWFDISRLVKTVGFRTKRGDIVMVGVRATRRVDYAAVARIVGVNRRDLVSLSPDEVVQELGVEPGSVSPLPLREGITVLLDEDILSIVPTVFCGVGRPDRTLEMAPADLVRLARAQVAAISRDASSIVED